MNSLLMTVNHLEVQTGSTLTAERGAQRQEMIEIVNKRRREEADKRTDTLCRAQVDSLRKTV